jgi:malonyl-CoA O-methyltransferase
MAASADALTQVPSIGTETAASLRWAVEERRTPYTSERTPSPVDSRCVSTLFCAPTAPPMSSSSASADGSVERVRDAYETWAGTYDTQENPTRDCAASVLRDTLPPLDGLRVLEFGCGTGLNTAVLADTARSVAAFDLSPAMLEAARTRVPADHVRFLEHDVTRPWPLGRLGGGARAFDLVVGTLVLEHVGDLAFVYRQSARALRPGGHLILCEYHPFRQRMGKQATFDPPTEERTVEVDSFRHTVADYLNPALDAGLQVQHVREDWHSTDADTDPPRLLTLHFQAGD